MSSTLVPIPVPDHVIAWNTFVDLDKMKELSSLIFCCSNFEQHMMPDNIDRKEHETKLKEFRNACMKINSVKKGALSFMPEYMKLMAAIQPKLLKRLQHMYRGQDFRRDVFTLFGIYQHMVHTDKGCFRSIPHELLPRHTTVTELFASPLDTNTCDYYSVFPFEKQLWSSRGSLWTVDLAQEHKGGVLVANPPFDQNVIKKMADKLLHDLPRFKHPVDVIVILPVWDAETQKRFDLHDELITFEQFEPFNALNTCKYRRWKTVLRKSECLMYDYLSGSYQEHATIHVLHLTNYMSSLPVHQYFEREWMELSRRKKYTLNERT